MQMKMEDSLTGIRVDVDHGPVTLLSNAELVCNLSGNFEHVRQEWRILRSDVIERRNMLLRTDQNMHGSLWTYVMKGVHPIVFVNRL